jgi:hypothetical protein
MVRLSFESSELRNISRTRRWFLLRPQIDAGAWNQISVVSRDYGTLFGFEMKATAKVQMGDR